MNALIRGSLIVGCLMLLAGCPEKKAEGGGAAQAPASSAAPAKAPSPGGGGW